MKKFLLTFEQYCCLRRHFGELQCFMYECDNGFTYTGADGYVDDSHIEFYNVGFMNDGELDYFYYVKTDDAFASEFLNGITEDKRSDDEIVAELRLI